MTRIPIRRPGLVLLTLSLLLPLSPLSAEDEQDLRGLLRDALYTEEVTRDSEAAAKQYEALLSQHDAQRAFAASALFRLAEVRRKQDRKDAAITLYQKLLARFPEAEAEAKLAREKLAALGGKLPEANAPADGAEDKELKRLQELANTNPDAIRDPSILSKAARESWLRVLKFFLEKNPGFDLNATSESVRFTALEEASDVAALESCRILLDAGADPNDPDNRNALVTACGEGYLRLVELLLDRGADPNCHGTQQPLRYAILGQQRDVVTLLLKKGAELNLPLKAEPAADGSIDLIRQFRSPDFGTPLHVATAMEGTGMLEFLLKLGADPNIAEPSTGLTPLHIAANPLLQTWPSRPDFRGNPAAIPLLLKAGAKPDPETKAFAVGMTPQENPTYPAGITPLALAIQSGNVEAARQLIEAGASAKRPGLLTASLIHPDMLELLLKHGADPNEQDKRGNSILLQAIKNNDLPSVRLLLEAGADPDKGEGPSSPLTNSLFTNGREPMAELLLAKGAKPDGSLVAKAIEGSNWKLAMRLLDAGAPLPESTPGFPSAAPLIAALRSADAFPLIEKLLAMGAKPEDAWIKSGFNVNYYSGHRVEIARPVRSFLFRRFLLPQMEEGTNVRIVIHRDEETEATVLDDPSPLLAPRSLAHSLLEPMEAFSSLQRIIPADRVTIWRKSGEGWAAAAELPLDSKEDFPVLQRGDVIELTDGPDPAKLRDQPRSDIFVPELRWSLRKRVSFPVTVEIDGKAQEVTLRGDRLVFDPAVPAVVPLGGARRVMQFFWRPQIDLDGFTPIGPRSVLESMNVVVRRSGWPDIRLPFSGAGQDFPLRAGDRISLESPEIRPEDAARRRKERVAVEAPGLPYIRHFGKYYSAGSNPDSRTIPSLLQAVAEVTQLHRMKDAPSDAAALPMWLVERQWALSFIQRPDLSKIRIRRLQEDGSEKVLDVDLAKIIADTPEDAAVEEVRKADLTLVGGDIVEIPVLPAEGAKPWSGLTPKEDAFLSKALSCRIQVTDPNGNIRLQEIRFRAPRIIATEAGPIPLPIPESVSSLNGSASLSSTQTPKVTREGQAEAQIDPWQLFLKEGDRVSLSPRARVAPPVPSR